MFRNFSAQMKYILPAKNCVETKEKKMNDGTISIYERTT